MTAIDEAGQLLAQARTRRDSHYPDAAAAAAEAVPQPGPARDRAEAQIRALWDDAIATNPGRDGVSPGAVTTGHTASAEHAVGA